MEYVTVVLLSIAFALPCAVGVCVRRHRWRWARLFLSVLVSAAAGAAAALGCLFAGLWYVKANQPGSEKGFLLLMMIAVAMFVSYWTAWLLPAGRGQRG